MPNLAVKLWGDADAPQNPRNYPAAWPCEARDIGESTSLPAGIWQLMTVAQYESYKSIHQAEYDSWEASQKLAQQSATDAKVQDLADIYTSLESADVNWGTLTQAQQVLALRTAIRLLLALKPFLREMYKGIVQ